MSASIDICAVVSRADWSRFIDCPADIYGDGPNVYLPFSLERKLHLSRFNPFFKQGKVNAWIASRNGRPVGRILASVDYSHRQHLNVLSGHFGMFECVDDQVVANALVGAAEAWLKAEGTTTITGPFDLTINQESGQLVNGFDTPPQIMMPHGMPWQDTLLAAAGYAKARDLYAYWADDIDHLKLGNDAALNSRSDKITIRTMLIAEVNGVPAGFCGAIPNLNESFSKMHDMRLLPGLLSLIKDVRGMRFDTVRLPLMGISKRYHRAGLATAMIREVCRNIRNSGPRSLEVSWVLEDNIGMNNFLKNIGFKSYKTYRIYEKCIAL